MRQWISSLLNKHIQSLQPYESARRLFSGGRDWLNANESPFSHTYTISPETFNRYPDCQPEQLVAAYASYAEVQAEQVLVTRGADEGIELLIRAFCPAGSSSVVICPPTYGMYAISAETCNVQTRSVPLRADFSLDLEGICAVEDARLIFICSPNNPTGTLAQRDDVRAIIEHFQGKALVVIDEAYIEFANDESWSQELASYENLVILRTMSKAFGLAGLRCGFTLANKDIIKCLLKVIAPYPVPAPVAQIALQALSAEGIKRLRNDLMLLSIQRAILAESLAQSDTMQVVGSTSANFVLFQCENKDALMQHLVDNGMLIRDQSKQVGLNDCLRATVGTQQQQQRLLSLITTFYQQRSETS